MTAPLPKTVAEAMSLATSCQRAGKLADAEGIYRKILEVRPDHPGANHNLGLIALGAGRGQEACDLLRRAVAADPGQPIFRNSLAEALRVCGLAEAAEAEFLEAIRLAPEDPVPRNNLGLLLVHQGRQADAEQAFLKAIELQPRYEKAILNLVAHGRPDAVRQGLENHLSAHPEDAVGARAMLAALGFGPTPERASEAHMQHLYSVRAGVWGEDGGYRAHQVVAGALAPRLSAPADILDAGCGTGLLGPLLRPIASALHGVDISAPMLDGARGLGVYDELFQADLIAHLCARPGAYDAIASAATLIHFGDLSAPLQSIAGALRPGGLAAFTLFPNEADGAGYSVGELEGGRGGVFFHGRRYVAEQAVTAGLELVSLTDEVHETRKGSPYMGLLAVCRKPAA